METIIDLRSDTVTSPSRAMLEAMTFAVTGDDVYGEDPTVNALEEYAAQLTKKEKALFVTSGTQGNLTAILSHCGRGDEYIAGSDAHTYKYEAGGAAVLGSVQPQPVPFNSRGEIPLHLVDEAIKPLDHHFARTKLLCLENTKAGKVLSLEYLSRARQFTKKMGLSLHLDGARAFNAAVKLGVPISDITRHVDSCSLCLSKGLGGPMGSVLVGDASLIESARKWRKMLGGGMRQAGIMAAAGLFALKNHVTDLSKDHEKAVLCWEGLRNLKTINLQDEPQTNMVILQVSAKILAELQRFLRENGVLISSERLVFHRDISIESSAYLVELFETFDASR
jgi:threonine aldolase